MPTLKRKWYPGSSSHVTARGNHKDDIFKDREDFEYYLTLIEEAKEYFKYNGYKIYCYCLMSNHVHMLIKTEEAPESLLIGRINGIYAKYFNKKYNYIGHLFQDRFHNVIINNVSQMLEVSRYIHLNPVRANIVEKPEDYMWSSYNMYIGNKLEENISSTHILSYYMEGSMKGSMKGNKRELYKAFVESGITPGV